METEKTRTGIYPAYYYQYIQLVEDENLLAILEDQLKKTEDFFKSVPEGKYLYKYAEGKWSVKEIIQHMIDTERVFSYRALAVGRNDPNALPSFDQNVYAKCSNADNRNWRELTDEFLVVRKSTIFLFKSFSEEQLNKVGKVRDQQMSVTAMGYTIAGHFAHHINILKERYLTN
jgi:hypothetical protein